ncbi:hypothetical protein FH972_025065 [Carpinus fangiana]|uniref:14-3-3 domain-containing protein n=1 Tax=Carpinus fangiana TaxID=176857 RepID=A0A5N6L061_9ROSI|nr:hypothetical protein FH972_025065 [Carpinus fangiana]
MAVHDVDQKILARLSVETASTEPDVSKCLYQLLGLSVMLTKRLRRARRLRKLDSSRDTKSLAMYQRIIWLSRDGLSITEWILPKVSTGQYGIQLRIFAAKLRASFYHIFALFHNQPPVTNMSPTLYALQPMPEGGPKFSPPHPRGGNGPDRPNSSSRRLHSRAAMLRDTIPSMTSEASYITNPYARGEGTDGDGSITPPPGLPQPSAFILPSINFLPLASSSFKSALDLASELLPGSAPLRLTIALEYCAFLWDCLHDHDASRRLASKTIREVYREQAGMEDSEFEDAADLVGTLGRMMRRKSNEATPRIGAPSPGNPGRGGFITPQLQQQQTPSPQTLAAQEADASTNRTLGSPTRNPGRLTPSPPSPSPSPSVRNRISRKAVGTGVSPSRLRSSSSAQSIPRKPVPIRKSPPRSPGREAGYSQTQTPTRTTGSTLVPSPAQTPSAERPGRSPNYRGESPETLRPLKSI